MIGSKPEYNSLKSIQISTVDAFQGSEKEIIILNTVRTSGIGFIGDKKRLNVAITRAKRNLIIVGSENVLATNPYWNFILSFTKEVGSLLSIQEIENKCK